MNITFFSPTLNIGGYEKVIVTFANELSKNTENNITIVCGSDKGELRKSVLPEVKIDCLNCKTRTLLLKLTKYLKTHSIDVFYIGFRIYNVIGICAKKISGNKMKVCVSQHGYESGTRIQLYIYGKIINCSDVFVGITQNIMNFEKEKLKLTCKCSVVGNPVIEKKTFGKINSDSWFETDDRIIVTCGRLSEDKNYSLAILILKELVEKGYKYKLLILGNGPEEKKLRNIISENKLERVIRLQGFVENPVDYMRCCDVYLHTCDREGFGNTVVEAMYAGLPVVTTDCGGPVELIEGNKYGICFGDGHAVNAIQEGSKAILAVNNKKYSKQKEKALQFEISKVSQTLLKEFKEIV